MTETTFIQEALDIFQQWQLSFSIFLVVFAALLIGAALRIIIRKLADRAHPLRHVWMHGLLSSAALPAQFLVWVAGIAIAARLVVQQKNLEAGGQSMLDWLLGPTRNIVIILVILWFLLRAINQIQENIETRAKNHGRELDPTATDAISKLAKASVFITAALMIMQSLGFSIAGLLAFGGMGGVAIGFAAQSLVANLLGGLTIFASRPFKVGEYIIIPGTDLMGGVEHIGWRATRLIGFDRKPFYVPNALFNTEPVINHSRMTSRQISETINIRYADIAAVREIVKDVQAMLASHPGIQHDFFAFNFNSYSTYSLQLFLYAFTVSTDYNDYLEVQQDVLIQISDIIHQHGAQLTGPVSTVDMPQLQAAWTDAPADVKALQERAGGRLSEGSANLLKQPPPPISDPAS